MRSRTRQQALTFGTTAGDMTSSSSASATALARGLRLAAAGATAALSDDAAAWLAAGLFPAGTLHMQAVITPHAGVCPAKHCPHGCPAAVIHSAGSVMMRRTSWRAQLLWASSLG